MKLTPKAKAKPVAKAPAGRVAVLTNAAINRAAIIAALNGRAGPTPIYILADLPQVSALNIPRAKLNSIVYNMKNTGLLESFPITDDKADVGYLPANGAARDGDKSGVTKRAYKSRKDSGPAALKVDLIKATGRVRIEIGGMLIEIGVIG